MEEEEQLHLSASTWSENQAIIAGGTVLHPEHGTWALSTNTVKGALEVTGAAFGLIALDQRFQSHVSWLVGDLMWNGTDRFGDAYIQELDTFAAMAGWSRRRLAAREYTSRMFSDVSLRRYSYDPKQWREFFPDQIKAGLDGVCFPVSWDLYREIGGLADVDLSNMCKMIQLAYLLRVTPQEARKVLKMVRDMCLDNDAIGETLDDLLESAQESSMIAFEKIDLWRSEMEEIDPKGKYLLLTGQVEYRRVVSLNEARFEDCTMCLKIGGKEGLQVVESFDGYNEILTPIAGEV